ncbi:MAG: ABC transporter ATP-binding protein [Crocinitomicaceae bacterium]|nr:ABC transporter ATP-binding protein [Crocinitomicaceae bacterium]
MIEIKNLSFRFGTHRALNELSFTIPEGSITALVGPNGAGKTTLMRCMSALAHPTEGQVLIDGIDSSEDPHACHRLLGFLADNFGLYEELTVEQSLAYFAAAHQMVQQRVEEVLEQVNLTDKKKEQIKSLSRGMRQRVGIAQAIIHLPKYLILDEPASGLDPEARIQLAELFKKLNKEGITLLVSSHILAELDQYANHLIVLKAGKLVETDFSMDTAAQKDSTYFIEAVNSSLLNSLSEPTLFNMIANEGETAIFSIEAGTPPHIALQYFLQQGIQVRAFGKHSVNIQDAYLKTIKNA